MYSLRVPGEAMQCLSLIMRKTYGYQKNTDAISLSQFEGFTGLPRSSVVRAIKKLVQMKIVITDSSNIVTTYSINESVHDWISSYKVVTSKRLVTKKSPSYNNVNGVVTLLSHTKENITKEIISKDITEENSSAKREEFGNKEINAILAYCKNTFKREDFRESQKFQRIYGMHLLNLSNKITKEKFKARCLAISQDEFRMRNCGSLKYIYSEVKSQIDQKQKFNFYKSTGDI
jgi:phage replication O-like protein O